MFIGLVGEGWDFLGGQNPTETVGEKTFQKKVIVGFLKWVNED